MENLLINPILYVSLLLPILLGYTYARWGKIEVVGDFCQCIADTLPAILLFFFLEINPLFKIFVAMILFANLSINRVNVVVGAIFYGLCYLLIAIFKFKDFNLIAFLIPLAIVIILIAFAFSIKKVPLLSKIGGGIYGLFAILPLGYLFARTFNIGFICLIVGDILLGVQYLYQLDKKPFKKINWISNLFFYSGVWLSALSL